MAPRIGFVSLGCAKATVDSERILTQLRMDGYDVAPDYGSADAVVVNTCGFIEAAIEESLDAIGEALAENGRVIVTGCLGADAERVRAVHPAVEAVTGPHAYEEVMNAVRECVPPPPHNPLISLVPDTGVRLTPRHYAWLKISEGCNHKCTFCIIPDLRGKLDSRAPGDVLEEAERLVAAGVRELLVISQDTSAYGIDLRYRTAFHRGRPVGSRFGDLCTELARLDCQSRLHYVYPYPHVDDVIGQMLTVEEAAAGQSGLLPYLDVPLQHANPRILKAMRRPAADSGAMLERLARWRELRPGMRIRSTFIAGFPTETEAEFVELLDFLRAARLHHVGCFAYSPVDGARANALEPAVPETEREARATELMRVQSEIREEQQQARIGERCVATIDGRDGERLQMRSWAEAPEVDGCLWGLATEFAGADVGDRVEVQIVDANVDDLFVAPASF